MLADLTKLVMASSIGGPLFTFERRRVRRKDLHVNRAARDYIRRTREELSASRADKTYQSKLGPAKRQTRKPEGLETRKEHYQRNDLKRRCQAQNMTPKS